jgi:4-alpha-glucanotransferase
MLLHLTSLPNSYPIGDLGPSAIAFLDFMVKGGQRWWQMLPIGPTGEDASPYQSLSAFAGNSLLISLDRLVEQGLLDRKDIALPVAGREGRVDYPAATWLKARCLRMAFEHFDTDRHGGRQSEVDAFVRAESHWLEDYSLFLAIQASEGTSDWTQWKQELRTRRPDAIIRTQEHFAGDIRFHQFVQWQFSVQWREFRAECMANGIWLIGDVPLFVSHQSADVWAHPELFKLDAEGNPTVVAGVPPDYFSRKGQVWGVPVYRWQELQRQSYEWWIQRLRMAFTRFDANRLDHFIGYVRTYEVPAQAKTAEEGQYRPAGGDALFEALRKALGTLRLIADDLGAITPEVTALRDKLQIPGTRVLQFEFGSSLGLNPVPPERLSTASVVYTGTHDNDTTAGWYRTLPGTQRRTLQGRLRANSGDVVWAMIHDALASNADTAILPVQDLLELGPEARMNTPGITKGNWQWRLEDGALTLDLAQRLRGMTEATGRLTGVANLSPSPTPSIKHQAFEPYEPRGCENGQTAQHPVNGEREFGVEAKR